METIYLCIIIFLFVLAVFDLIVESVMMQSTF